MEFTINVHITGMDRLADALFALAGKQGSVQTAVPIVQTASQVPPESVPVAPVPTPIVPANEPAPDPAPAPTSASAPALVQPATSPTPAVPVAAPAAYTLLQLQEAAGELVTRNEQDKLLGLLGKYQVQALTRLPADQYGAFATDLRGLGANI